MNIDLSGSPQLITKTGNKNQSADSYVLRNALKMIDANTSHSANASKKTYPYWFILNPAADKGRAKKRVDWLKKSLKRQELDTVIQLTTMPSEATAFASQAKTCAGIIVACGGDGTLNEVTQSLVHSDSVLGCLPIGSANDFFKNISEIEAEEAGISHLFNATVQPVDVGQVFYQAEHTSSSRFFLNSFGLGFSGRIAKMAAAITWLKGDLTYIYALLKVAANYEAMQANVKLHTQDGIISLDQEKIYMLSIGNGKVEAGKFKIAPQAEINDGWLDVCILKDISRSDLPRWILKYLTGKQIGESQIVYAKAKKIEIELFRPECLHMDGEVIENVQGKLTIEVRPRALNVLSSKKLS
ncbi:diacylglycerol kinase catalytic region [Chloroherpeton thalassium ATCC 35110]|uniref:Diacylglycerol kinase catalytic region n=1 Tax=Chloroherpeton thalassium (strain ATCC 35110 / GB-78) TaxID=517418 RepID=B3QU81_CHLT3|nr:YegS/Rv2252/BmrU family lipid kinase [Chloroherpeton thalassium]ACF14330.1 diacylglycerol kinase catalytic region [Chloroherpeton thalassium ATCC 35110]